MPKLCCARAPAEGAEERRVRRLAHSRLAPRDCLVRARMIVMRGDGRRTADIAAALAGHPADRARTLGALQRGGVRWAARPPSRWAGTLADRNGAESPARAGRAGAAWAAFVRGRLTPSPSAAIPLATAVEEWRTSNEVHWPGLRHPASSSLRRTAASAIMQSSLRGRARHDLATSCFDRRDYTLARDEAGCKGDREVLPAAARALDREVGGHVLRMQFAGDTRQRVRVSSTLRRHPPPNDRLGGRRAGRRGRCSAGARRR